MVASHLADTSVLARAGKPAVSARLDSMVDAGVIATCTIVELEVLTAARSKTEYRSLADWLREGCDLVPIEQSTLDRAVEVQRALSEGARHRGVSVPDLLIAAAAERAGLIVLHYDADFERIAEVTGQPAEWVVPRGTID